MNTKYQSLVMVGYILTISGNVVFSLQHGFVRHVSDVVSQDG